MSRSILTSSLFSLLFCAAVPGFAQDDTLLASNEEEHEKISLTTPARLPFADDGMPSTNSDERYLLKAKVDIPIIAVGSIWSGYAFTKIYSKDKSTPEQVERLDKNNLIFLDKWAAGKSSKLADKQSNYLFYGSIPVPFLLLADKKVRPDALKVGAMYWEAMAITGLLYTSSTYFVDRYRPWVYNKGLTMDERTSGNGKNAFFAGHVALVGTATFFTAKIFNDYHPNSPWRWVVWGGATAATGATAYLRHKGGYHFPTDIALGTAVGVLSGVLVPQLHKNKSFNPRLSVTPFSMGETNGISLTYKL